MKSLKRYVSILIIFILAISCNEDFLKDGPNFDDSSHTSPLFISPNWDADDYIIYLQDAGNANFTIAHAPEWLTVSAQSGQFSGNAAVLHCKANTCNDFSGTGIYYSYLTLSVEGRGNLAFPVAYISEGNPEADMENFFTLDCTNGFTASMSIKNIGEGVLIWHFEEYPEWLIPMSNTVNIMAQNTQNQFIISYNEQSFPFSENLAGKIIIATNDKNRPVVEVTVQVDLGISSFHMLDYYNTIDFGWAQTARSLVFSNREGGILLWEIEGCPEWITVSPPKGITHPVSGANLTIYCHRELLLYGENTDTIYLKTNDENNPLISISVTAIRSISANPDNVMDIPGNVVNAFMDKQSDILYLTTNQPDRLLTFDTNVKAIVRELPLNDAPTCFRLSEDGHFALIGHDGYVTYMDTESFSVINTIEVNHRVKDIEWGADNWCCYSVTDDNSSYLYWINLNTNEIEYDDQQSGYGFLRKIPNHYFMIAKTGGTNGTHVYNLTTRKKEYGNSCFVSGFFAENGEFMYSGEGNIYSTFSFLVNNPAYVAPPIGHFTPVQHSFYWIDHNRASQSIWCLSPWAERYTDYEIIQFDDTDFTKMKTYYYSDHNNNNPVMLQYLFTNQAGTELIVVRNVADYQVSWSLEFIPVN